LIRWFLPGQKADKIKSGIFILKNKNTGFSGELVF